MTDFKTRIYYRLEMTLESPMAVGSGENRNTDHDVVVDANGNPFIPATTIAGVLRSYFAEEKLQHEIFGDIAQNKSQTKLMIYDGLLQSCSKHFITTRDCVALEKKVGIKGRKFDLEAVEPGICFVSYLELLDEGYTNDIEDALTALSNGILGFGAKTTRGYGQVSLRVKKESISTYDEYIAFDMMGDWSNSKLLKLDKSQDAIKLKLSLESLGGVSIREYSTEINMPDYSQLTLHDEKKTPVIPGTSWAGAIRDRFSYFIDDDTVVSQLFGYVMEKTSISKKSAIIFSETQLSGGYWKIVTRNAIDRFSGATTNGALYTERTYYNGKGDLIIAITEKLDEDSIWALAASFSDLHNGILAVGGLTAVGRGLFRITAVNDIPLKDTDNIYEVIKGALQ